MMLYTLARQLIIINLLVVQVPGRMFAIDVSTVQMHCYLLFIQHHYVCFVQRKIPLIQTFTGVFRLNVGF